MSPSVPRPRIRREQGGDAPAVDRVVGDAFGGSAEVALVNKLRHSDAHLPDSTLVAEVEDGLCGFAMATRAEVRGSPGTNIAVVAPAAFGLSGPGSC